MGTVRVLLFSFILTSWVLCSALGQLTKELQLRPGQQEVLFKRQAYLEARRSKREAAAQWLGEDYDSNMVFLPADEPVQITPAGAAADMPTCLLCVCLTGSVYCEEVDPEMMAVPTLPKETAYLYARYNKIKKITNKDFADIVTLKRIDLTGNLISEIDDGAFSKLTFLEELNLSENRLVKLPMLPSKLIVFNANNNRLKTKGVKANTFKNNNITEVSSDTFCKSNNTYYVRTNLVDVRMDGNPVMLSKYPNSFICLTSLPIGKYR
ncbi:hypothetical protein UPYG_G00092130 [Umbra pygmaea]|uniref:Osteoglycin n=1 Tax=Umbra pygmaea TaxID=75934 RepID=A0ABD0XG37_UMBPY